MSKLSYINVILIHQIRGRLSNINFTLYNKVSRVYTLNHARSLTTNPESSENVLENKPLDTKKKKPISLLGLGNPKSARYWKYQLKKAQKYGNDELVDEAINEIPMYLRLAYETCPEEVMKNHPEAFRVIEAHKSEGKRNQYKKSLEVEQKAHFPFQMAPEISQLSDSISQHEANKPIDTRISNVEKSVSNIMDHVKKKQKLVGSVKYANDDGEEIDLKSEVWRANYGNANPNIPPSKVPCGGCGAMLHCADTSIPGYIPSERFVGLTDKQLREEICQRCLFFHHYNIALNVNVSQEEYPKILSAIKNHPLALIVLLVDLTDYPCSILPEIVNLVGEDKPFFVIGNKVDLLPQDSKGYLERMREKVDAAVEKVGIHKDKNLLYTGLISAKTGYGVETLITKFQKLWNQKGDVFIVGCTNVGKSTLFNCLLQSDFCKIGAVDIVQRATTSVWPGTTINLLKFPILRPTGKKLYQRTLRLKQDEVWYRQEMALRKSLYKQTRDSKYATLIGRIGMTFKDPDEGSKNVTKKAFDPDHADFKDGFFCFDTPGAVYSDQILDLLTIEELVKVLPKEILHPRTFALKHDQTLFVAGLGRVEVEELTGAFSVYITVFASEHLPVHIVPKEDADEFYQDNLGTALLAVPKGDTERLKSFPELQSKKFTFEGMGPIESCGDIVLSSTGWIAITMKHRTKCTLKVFTPSGRGLHERKPALLPHAVMFKGDRIKGTPAFENKYCSFLNA